MSREREERSEQGERVGEQAGREERSGQGERRGVGRR